MNRLKVFLVFLIVFELVFISSFIIGKSKLLYALYKAEIFLKVLERNINISQSLKPYYTEYSCRDCNVVLISIDTLRADHTGFMGYFRNTTPNLDRIAKESIVFNNAFAQMAITAPSHTSIFTSLYASQHGQLRNELKINDKFIILSEIMKAKGYETVAFVGDGAVDGILGFSKGFELYDDGNVHFSETIPKAINWVENNKHKKFFLFIHGYEPHEPYGGGEFSGAFVEENYSGVFKEYDVIVPTLDILPPVSQNLSKEDIDYVKAKYDADIKQADKYIGMFIDKLKEFDIYNKTILVMFSDHGEFLGEILIREKSKKNHFGHHDLYDETLHQVLILKTPKIEFPKRIYDVVSSIDIAPTVLELAGIGKFSQFNGKSLTDVVFAKNHESFSISESLPDKPNSVLEISVRTFKWRLIIRDDNFIELYDMENDNKQMKNIGESNKEIVDNLVNLYLKTVNYENEKISEPASSDKLTENLRQLGY